MRPSSPSSAVALVAALACSSLSCGDGLTRPTPTELIGGARIAPSAAGESNIRDAVHNGGNPLFYFLAPIAANPSVTGTFDANTAPQIDICEWSGGACGTVVARFSTTPAKGDGAVVVSSTAGDYEASWSLLSTALVTRKTYRIHVYSAAVEFGSVTVDVVRGRWALTRDDGSLAPLLAASELPIKFFVAQASGSPVSVIGPTGGTLTAQNGAVVFTVPPGALSTPVGITVSTPPDGLPTNRPYVPGAVFDFGPSGTTFATPATLTISYDPAKLPTGVDPRTLWLHYVQNGQWIAVPQGHVDVAAHTVTGQVAHFTPIGVAQSPVQTAILDLQSALALLGSTASDVAQAVRIKQKLIALFQLTDDPSYAALVPVFLAQNEQTACAEYKRYAGDVGIIPAWDYGTLNSLLTPILDWNAVMLQEGGTCPGAPPLEPLVAQLLTEFTSFYQATLADLDNSIGSLLQEFSRILQLQQSAISLDLSTIQLALYNGAQVPLANRLRSAAFTNCRARSRQTSPALLFGIAARNQAPYSTQDIQQDVEWCATQLSWQLLPQSGPPKASGTLGGTQPGAITTQATTRGIGKGKLRLSGVVTPYTCLDGSLNPLEVLAVLTPTGVILSRQQITGSNTTLLNGSVDIDLANWLSAVGIDPSQAGSATLLILRTSTACNGLLGSTAAYLLATITLTFPELTVSVTPGLVSAPAGSTQQFTATVRGTTSGAVMWTATGGSITSTTGLNRVRRPSPRPGNRATDADPQGVTSTATFTAGSVPGDYTVTATSVEDPTTSSTVSGTIVTPSVVFVQTFSVVSTTASGAPNIYQLADPASKSFSLSAQTATTVSGYPSGSSHGEASLLWADAPGGSVLAKLTGDGSAAASTSSVAAFPGSARAGAFHQVTFNVVSAPVTVTISSTCAGGTTLSSGVGSGYQFVNFLLGSAGLGTLLDVDPRVSGSCTGTWTMTLLPGQYSFDTVAYAEASWDFPTAGISGAFTLTFKP